MFKKIMAFMATFKGLGLLFHILLGFRCLTLRRCQTLNPKPYGQSELEVWNLNLTRSGLQKGLGFRVQGSGIRV